MASQELPITLTELFQLTSIGIELDSINFDSCTLESDAFVCIREEGKNDSPPQIMIFELNNLESKFVQGFTKAESAIMHWTKKVIAMQTQRRILQISDLTAPATLKLATMNEDVIFWKWISESSIGIVTDTSVYHWDIFDQNQAAPVEVFKRDQNLVGLDILNYRVSENGKWMVCVGVGALQLYSRDRRISQATEGHMAAFGSLRLDGAPADTEVFIFSVFSTTSAKLHIVEIDHQSANPVFPEKVIDIDFPATAAGDIPVAIHVSQKYSIIYLVTLFARLHLYDLESGICIFHCRISDTSIFATTANSKSTGLVCIDRNGQVLSVTVDETTIISHLLENATNSSLAVKLALRAGLSGAEHLYANYFDQLLKERNHAETVETAANSSPPQTIERFKALPAAPRQTSIVSRYLGMLVDTGKQKEKKD